MRNRNILLTLFLSCVPFKLLQAQQTVFSPGIKLGYTFGEDGGFTYGFEFSYVIKLEGNRDTDIAGLYIGPVFDIDFSKHFQRIHFGLEAGTGPFGVCFGPSFVSVLGEAYQSGYSVIPYAGLLAYPYYNFTKVGEVTFREWGSYFKYHIGKGI